MAGNKINTKTKGKEEKGKINKSMSNTSEETEDIDFTLLRKPIHTSITGFAQARKIFDLATEELKGLLSNECDLLYECKVCRNIFRSLANFISHKRVYCKEKFNSSVHGHFINTTSTVNEILKIKRMEEGYQESLKQKIDVEHMDINEFDDRIPMTKDLTAILEKITNIKGMHESSFEEQQVILENIPNSSVAVFQSINFNEKEQVDNMQAQVKELDNILSHDNAVLQSNGKFKTQSSITLNKNGSDSDNVIQISDDDDNCETDILKCKICDLQFSTQKTLKFHMKYKHVESRLVYPCPDCLEIFSTSWSVYRHLFKVHRKTAAQIRRLRESIQAKAFRMNNPPAFYEKRKNNIKPVVTQKISEEERLDQENQAWMDNMEGDGELPRCGGCGRTFERRAALAAHTHTCQPRSRALARRPQENKKIEIQIRKDYNKGPAIVNLTPKTGDSNDNKTSNDIAKAVTKTQKDDDRNLEEIVKEIQEATIDVSEDDQKSSDNAESPEKSSEIVNIYKPVIKLPFAQHTEKSNLTAFKQRIQLDVELNKLFCKKCEVKYNGLQELYDHMAGHYKWMRYACKLCNYKHYDFEKLPEHVKVVHKLKGDTDFYFSTVKAIDGTEALELSESMKEQNDVNENSPDSRRPSRCSSDSSRLSDDSSCSSTRLEGGSRKRKICSNKNNAKRKKDSVVNDDSDEKKDGEVSVDKAMKSILGLNETPASIKAFEDNSSDMDDIDEKNTKKHIIENTSTVASRRPVRKRTKPKNEDFEYDLSNLLKIEAQGYRDSQSGANMKSNQTKKKLQQENQSNFDGINKDHCGALNVLSKKAVETASAHMKTSNFSVYSVPKDQRPSNIFVRPMLPKNIPKGDKISPKKAIEDSKDNLSPNKDSKIDKTTINDPIKKIEKDDMQPSNKAVNDEINYDEDQKSSNSTVAETVKSNLNIPTIVPIKFRHQSLELIKNPIINKNITDFTKAGMKTKILVIKPINRNKDGTQTVNKPLKLQTIKLKDLSKSTSSNEDKSSDQVVVVKVSKVDSAVVGPITNTCNINHEKTITSKNSVDNITEVVDKSCSVSETTENITDDNKSKEVESDEMKDKCIITETRPIINSDKTNSETISTCSASITTNPESIITKREQISANSKSDSSNLQSVGQADSSNVTENQ